MRDLSRIHDIYLVGSISGTPVYTKASDPLLKRPLYRPVELLYKLFFVVRFLALSHRNTFFRTCRSVLERVYNFLLEKETVNFLGKYNVDVIYSFPVYPDIYPINVSKKLGLHLIIEFWEDQVCLRFMHNLSKGLDEKIALKEMERGYNWLAKMCKFASAIIVPTTVIKRRLVSLGIQQEKIHLAPVCSDPFTIRNAISNKFWNNQIVLFVGSMSAHHDIDCLFKAINKVKSRNVFFILAGGSRKAIKKYDRKLKSYRNRVKYVGTLSDEELTKILASSDICLALFSVKKCSPGFFPHKIILYMLAQKAVIATDLPEIREMFAGQEAGLLIPQGDSDKLARAIDDLLSDKARRDTLGRNARALAESKYLWKHHSAIVSELFFKCFYQNSSGKIQLC